LRSFGVEFTMQDPTIYVESPVTLWDKSGKFTLDRVW
jgi:hypothetical protein